MSQLALPLFPKFKKLKLTDKKIVEHITRQYKPYSDFNFVSLWSYNIENDVIISFLYSNLVMRFRDYITNDPFYSFIGTKNTTQTIKLLLNYAKKKGQNKPYLKLVPEVSIASLPKNHNFTINEDRDNFDYILSIDELAHLQSSNSYSRRKAIQRFLRRNLDATVIQLNLFDPKVRADILSLYLVWEDKKRKKQEETQHETIAIERLLKDSKHLALLGVGVYIKKLMIGFLIIDTANKPYAQTHFLKYDPNYKGLRHLMHHTIAKQLYKKGYRYLNLEQDLGIPGLRIAKEQSYPIAFLKKYIITEK